jgi:hypothetical protein
MILWYELDNSKVNVINQIKYCGIYTYVSLVCGCDCELWLSELMVCWI